MEEMENGKRYSAESKGYNDKIYEVRFLPVMERPEYQEGETRKALEKLKKEMAELEHRILNKENLWESDLTKSHAEGAEKWMPNYEITDDNIHAIVQKEIGFVFAKVLECAGVYKRTPEGQAAFKKFLECI